MCFVGIRTQIAEKADTPRSSTYHPDRSLRAGCSRPGIHHDQSDRHHAAVPEHANDVDDECLGLREPDVRNACRHRVRLERNRDGARQVGHAKLDGRPRSKDHVDRRVLRATDQRPQLDSCDYLQLRDHRPDCLRKSRHCSQRRLCAGYRYRRCADGCGEHVCVLHESGVFARAGFRRNPHCHFLRGDHA